MIIGITGGIASGKTLCTDWFLARGVPVVDADIIARQLTEKEGVALPAILAQFPAAFSADGVLNRAALREIIFNDTQARAQLEAILHPLIRAEIIRQLQATPAEKPYQLLSAPLLFENGLESLCQAVIVVDVPEALQIARGRMRDQQKSGQIQRIIAAQMPQAERLSRADFVVDNSQMPEETYRQLAAIHATLIGQK